MQKTSIFIFDLDDTLYDELSYVYSGFLAVAKFLEKATKLPGKIFRKSNKTAFKRDLPRIKRDLEKPRQRTCF